MKDVRPHRMSRVYLGSKLNRSIAETFSEKSISPETETYLE